MTERELERRLRAWYRRGPEEGMAPDSLASRVSAIPELALPPAPRELGGRRLILLLAALLLAIALIGGTVAVGSGLLQWSTTDGRLVSPADLDACQLLAAAHGDLDPVRGANGIFPDHDTAGLPGSEGCAYGWDSGWGDTVHLLWHLTPASLADGEQLLPRVFADSAPVWQRDWRPTTDRADVTAWIAEHVADPAPDREPFSAAAVSAPPYFFVVTGGSVRQVTVRAEAVLALLVELASVDP